MAIGIEMKVSGFNELADRLETLNADMHKRMLPDMTADSVNRLKRDIVENIPVGPRGHEGDTGGWRAQQTLINAEPLPREPDVTGAGLPLPTRTALGVSEDDPVFYPFIVEFGSERITATVAPIRTAVNAQGEREFIQMGRVIGVGLDGLMQAIAGGRLAKPKWWHAVRPSVLPEDF